jgi:hypothetical protein
MYLSFCDVTPSRPGDKISCFLEQYLSHKISKFPKTERGHSNNVSSPASRFFIRAGLNICVAYIPT